MSNNATPTSQTIIGEALRLFRRNGYAATSMSLLSQAVGIEKSALYYHFPSKQTILERILEYEAGEWLPKLESIVSSAGPVEKRLAEVIRLLALTATGDNDRHVIWLAVTQFEQRGIPDALRSGYVRDSKRIVSMVKKLIALGMESGAFRKGNPTVVAWTVVGAIHWLVFWYKADGTMTPEELADALVDQLMNGVCEGVGAARPT